MTNRERAEAFLRSTGIIEAKPGPLGDTFEILARALEGQFELVERTGILAAIERCASLVEMATVTVSFDLGQKNGDEAKAVTGQASLAPFAAILRSGPG